MASKMNYMSWIHTYSERKETYIAAYNEKIKEHKAELQKKLVRVNKKLKGWKRQVKRIQQREEKLKYIYDAVVEFTGVDFSSADRKGVLARQLYYRYGLENGIRGNYLNDYINATGESTPGRCRKEMIQSAEGRATWRQFLSFMDDLKNVD